MPAWAIFHLFDFGINAAWLTAAMTGQILLAWLKLLALGGDLAKAEPKTLRYRVLHAVGRLVCGGRKRRLKIQATWPWVEAITAEGNPPGPVETPAPGPSAGPLSYPDAKIVTANASGRPSAPAINPDE